MHSVSDCSSNIVDSNVVKVFKFISTGLKFTLIKFLSYSHCSFPIFAVGRENAAKKDQDKAKLECREVGMNHQY